MRLCGNEHADVSAGGEVLISTLTLESDLIESIQIGKCAHPRTE